jgi:hypothetical protein
LPDLFSIETIDRKKTEIPQGNILLKEKVREEEDLYRWGRCRRGKLRRSNAPS